REGPPRRESEAGRALGSQRLDPALARAVAAEERQGGGGAVALDRAATPGAGLDGDELSLGADPPGGERGLRRRREGVRLQVGREGGPGQRGHARAPSTRPNGVAGS